MARKVILDVDPGIDNAMAICLALSSPDAEVVAVTAVGGNVGPAQATRNVQAIMEQLDPPRWPRLAQPPIPTAATCRPIVAGSTAATDWAATARHGRAAAPLPSEKVICDQVRDAPHLVTIVPWGR